MGSRRDRPKFPTKRFPRSFITTRVSRASAILSENWPSLCRSAAVQIADGTEPPILMGPGKVNEVLGPRKFFSEVAGSKPQVGVSTGLAWTPVGGQILFIEARKMTGKGDMRVTGQVGDVMAESGSSCILVREIEGSPDWSRSRTTEHLRHSHSPSKRVDSKRWPISGHRNRGRP